MKIAHLLIPCLAAALFSSCASVSVKDERRAGRQPLQKPAKIYVADFDTDRGRFNLAGEPAKNPDQFKQQTADLLASYVVKNVNDHVAPAQRARGTGGLPKSGWLVAGEFIRVNTGSRVLRSGVGLGAGGTKMETRAEVYDLSAGTTNPQPFMTFETTGGSNAMPGLLTNPGTTAVISMTTQAMMGVTDDAARTSRMITGALNGYFIERGWLDRSRAYSAKKPGKYRLVHQNFTP